MLRASPGEAGRAGGRSTGIRCRAWRQTCWYLREVFTNDSLYEVAPDTVSRIVGEDLWVVSGGRDGTTDAKYAAVRIWDARSGKLVHALKGHKQAITSVIYKPDIRMILTGSLDSSARLWNPMNISAFAGDQSLQTYSGYTHEVVGMACQTQGKYMVSASGSGTLHLWDIDQGISLRKKGMSSNFFLAISLIFAYPLGGLVDRWHPLRVTMWMKILNIPFPFLNYFFHVDYMSGLWLLVIHEPIGLLSAAAQMPLAVMLLPRAKYGQFSSANCAGQAVYGGSHGRGGRPGDGLAHRSYVLDGQLSLGICCHRRDHRHPGGGAGGDLLLLEASGRQGLRGSGVRGAQEGGGAELAQTH